MVGKHTRVLLRVQLFLKHLFDKIIAVTLILAAFPITLVVALAIVLEDGFPVFFVQKRLGKDGHVFHMLKFRSMKMNSAYVFNVDGSTKVEDGDPRVTRVGALLRRTSLDELPQLLHVFVGQMSLVGPRPDLPEHLNLYTDMDHLKLRMRPGITGLPQVMGRNDLPWKERICLDTKYINEYSLLLDLRILFQTIFIVLSGRGVAARGDRHGGN